MLTQATRIPGTSGFQCVLVVGRLECLQQSLLGFEAMIFYTRYIITHLYNHTQVMNKYYLLSRLLKYLYLIYIKVVVLEFHNTILLCNLLYFNS